MMRSSAAGAAGWTRETDGGSSLRIAPSRLARVLPSNAVRPVSISNSSAPNAKMSVRASASSPSICSGAMYWNVPRIVPCTVRFAGDVGGIDCAVAATTGTALFASPKSSSFAPASVSMTFAGLRSRCTMPERCAVSSALANLDRAAQRAAGGSGRAGSRSASGLPVEKLQNQEVDAVAESDVEQRTDVRMVEGRDRARLPFEALAALRVCPRRGVEGP